MASPIYRIRPMKSGDIATVSALEQEVFHDPWPQTAFVQEVLFNSEAHYFILESCHIQRPASRWPWGKRASRRIYGFVGLRADLGQGHISTLAVHPAWRGHGLGELLLITVLAEALEMGLTNVTLEVRASNWIAQSLYRKYGFQTIERKSHYYRDGEDALLLIADITGACYREQLANHRQILEESTMETWRAPRC